MDDQSFEFPDRDSDYEERVTLRAEIVGKGARALDPQAHDATVARDIAVNLCTTLSEVYRKHDRVRPETLAVAVQTVIETLLTGVEREGVDAANMRVALANSILINGDAEVSIEINGKSAPSHLPGASATIH